MSDEEKKDDSTGNSFDLEALKGNPDFQKYLNSQADKRVSQALETWKAKEPDRLAAFMAEKEKESQLSPQEIRIKELEEENKRLTQETQQAALRAKQTGFAQKAGIPGEVFNLDLTTDEGLQKFSEIWGAQQQKQTNENIKANGRTPKKGEPAPSKSWGKMTLTERTQLFKDNPNLARKLMNDSG